MGAVISINHDPCTGCKTCEMLCSLHHFGQCNPVKSAIRIIRRERDGLVLAVPLVCQQCEPAPCIEACPTGALSRDRDGGSMRLDRDECTVCNLCVEACRIGCLTLNDDGTEIIQCDLCQGDPQCVPACHAHCLTMEDSGGVDSFGNVDRIFNVLKREDLLNRVHAKEV